MKRSNLILLVALVVGAAAYFQFARRPAEVEPAFDGEPQLVAATFASAWCSACKVLKPRLAAIMPGFAKAPVRFVEYDFTFGRSDGIRAAAAEDGLAQIYPRYEGATGFTLLVDAESGEIIDMLTMKQSSKEMGAAIEDALAVASAR